MINLNELKRLMVRREETIERWDYLTTFKPPAHLSIEGQKHMKVHLIEGTVEY